MRMTCMRAVHAMHSCRVRRAGGLLARTAAQRPEGHGLRVVGRAVCGVEGAEDRHLGRSGQKTGQDSGQVKVEVGVLAGGQTRAVVPRERERCAVAQPYLSKSSSSCRSQAGLRLSQTLFTARACR